MSEASHPLYHSLNDPVRIVYHAGSRTFARLFNERSLEEVKDLVRRKLGLGQETDVTLKQIRSDTLLDLEDDGDFQAFRVLLKSCLSIDIQVTVGPSQGPAVLPPAVAPLAQPIPSLGDVSKQRSPQRPSENSSVGKRTATVSPALPSKGLPHGATTAEASATPAKTLTPSTRKRKVTFDGDASAPVPDESIERQVSALKSPAIPEQVGSEKPPKKKLKKVSTKRKDIQATETTESPATKVPKLKSKKSDSGEKASTSVSNCVEIPEVPVKKQRKHQKDDGTKQRKSSTRKAHDDVSVEAVHQGGAEQSSRPVSHQLAEQPSAEVDITKTRQSEKITAPIGACAAIPRTSASAIVQSEVAAAILSKASVATPPQRPAKRKYVKRDTKKPYISSSAIPLEPATVLDAHINEIPKAFTEHLLEQVIQMNEPTQQASGMNGPLCPICLEEPFHIRYCCPIVLKGPDAIRERLEELDRTNMADQPLLIKQLEGLLHDSKAVSEPSLAVSTVQSISPPPSISFPRTPIIPGNSHLSEVTVESKDEGSSSESSDHNPVERAGLLAPRRYRTPNDQPLPSDGDLEAIIRGPVSKGQSISEILSYFSEDEHDKDTHSEEEEAELEVDPDEETSRSRRQSFRPIAHSSDSESEEELTSCSPLRLVEDASNDFGCGIESSREHLRESLGHKEGAMAVRYSVDPPILEGRDDVSEETHVGSEDCMVVDESSKEKAVVIVPEEQSSPDDKPRESARTEVEPVLNQLESVPIFRSHKEVEPDPIEPADELALPGASCSLNTDPIEVPSEGISSLFSGLAESTPKPGVSRRIKTRHGRILDDEAERPVLLEQLFTQATDVVAPLSGKGKSRRKVAETSIRQELAATRRSPRFNSTSTPTAVTLLRSRVNSGTGAGKVTQTPAQPSEEHPDGSKNDVGDGVAWNGKHPVPTTSLIVWETLEEPSSPSVQMDDSLLDELTSSSPQPDDDTVVRGRSNDKVKARRSRKSSTSNLAKSSHEKGLFDLSSSQVPFPYSQNPANLEAETLPNGKGFEGPSDSEDEPRVTKKTPTVPVPYRSLSQLSKMASDSTLFSPSLPTPANKSMTTRRAKKRPADEGSSSSSSSDAEKDEGSKHIPRERRAGSVLGTKKKGLLSKISKLG